MKIDIPEIITSDKNNPLYYNILPSITTGGYTIHIQPKSELDSTGLLEHPYWAQKWKPLINVTAGSYEPELKFYDNK